MWQPFYPVARQTLTDPREAATTLMSMGVPQQVVWPAFFLFIVLSALLGSAFEAIAPPNAGSGLGPLVSVIFMVVANIASVFAIWKVGQLMGGTGSFNETLLLTAFLQALLFFAQAVQLALFLVVPPIGSLTFVALVCMAVWVYVNFVAALHGFRSLWRALGCMLLATVGVAFFFMFLMALFGVQMVGPA